MAIPVYDSAGSGVDIAAQPSIGVPYPATVAANDLLVMHFLIDQIPSPSPPTGWSTLRTTPFYYTYYKVATGSESGTLTVPLAAAATGSGRMYRFTGVDVSGTPYEAVGAIDAVAPGDGLATDVGVTTAGADRLAVNMLSTFTTTMSSFTGETGGDWTERAAYKPASSYCLQLQAADMSAAGTIDGGTFSLGGAVTYWNLGFALIGATGVPGSPTDTFVDVRRRGTGGSVYRS